MPDFFSDDARRNPFPLYDRARRTSPVVHVPPPFDGWLIFDYASVKQALTDHATFSSRVPAPRWFVFFDPPLHTKLRGLISRAFTPRGIAHRAARRRFPPPTNRSRSRWPAPHPGRDPRLLPTPRRRRQETHRKPDHQCRPPPPRNPYPTQPPPPPPRPPRLRDRRGPPLPLAP